MDIIFICGSLEPGKDGVGDYTRRLAVELRKQKVSVAMLALNDRFVGNRIETPQELIEIEIPVLRLGRKIPFRQKTRTAKKWIEKYDPEWLSLQFVPYSFNRKGIPWMLSSQLGSFSKGRKWHIMFHELWIEKTNLKSSIIASLQAYFIRKLCEKLQPGVIHTSLPAYKKRLKSISLSAKKLPIFSNIMENRGYLNGYNHLFNIVFFSQFTPRESVIDFLRQLVRELFIVGQDFRVLLLGGNQMERLALVTKIRNIPGVNRRIIYRGFLEDLELYKVIHNSDLCITPVPRHVLGKSGSVAAFLSQGIPVAAPFVKKGYEKLGIGFYEDHLKQAIIEQPNLESFKRAREAARKAPDFLSLTKIAGKFSSDLFGKSVSSLPVQIQE